MVVLPYVTCNNLHLFCTVVSTINFRPCSDDVFGMKKGFSVTFLSVMQPNFIVSR